MKVTKKAKKVTVEAPKIEDLVVVDEVKEESETEPENFTEKGWFGTFFAKIFGF